MITRRSYVPPLVPFEQPDDISDFDRRQLKNSALDAPD